MRNLVKFIIRHYVTLLFILVEGFALFLAVQSNRFQRASFLNNATELSGQFYGMIHSFTEYLNVKSENEKLARENMTMRRMLKANYVKNIKNFISVNDSIYKQKYNYTLAKVINNSVYKQNNLITLNKGRKQGILPEMAVIGPEGVVGIVKDVSANFSVVIPIINVNAKISAKVKQSGNFGTLSWDGADYRFASLNEIPFHVKFNISDTVVTSGYSVIFPEGIMIGTIEKFDLNEGNNFYNIQVRLSTEFSSLNHVYIIGNLYREEQLKLENANLTND